MRGKDAGARSGTARNIYLTKEQTLMLSAIAKAMGETQIGIEPSRSQLIGKAVQNYITLCRQEPHLNDAIKAVEQQLRLEEALRSRVSRNPNHKPKIVQLKA